MAYVPLGQPRFQIKQTAQGDVLIIPAVRNLVVALFLSFWLVVWTIGGGASVAGLFDGFEPFVMVWLMGWAAGWCTVVLILSWMISGKQTLCCFAGDLEVGLSIFGFARRKTYEGRAIRSLDVTPVGDLTLRRGPQMPSGVLGGSGAIRFTYGARTCYLAAGMDQAEAARIVTWLKAGLPAEAFGSP